MTDEEDKANELINEQMKICEHDPKRLVSGGIVCSRCGGKFALFLLPRRAKIRPIELEDEDLE